MGKLTFGKKQNFIKRRNVEKIRNLFDYIGLVYCRNNDATPLDLVIHILLYYLSLKNELRMESHCKTIMTIKILRKYVIRRHREEKE